MNVPDAIPFTPSIGSFVGSTIFFAIVEYILFEVLHCGSRLSAIISDTGAGPVVVKIRTEMFAWCVMWLRRIFFPGRTNAGTIHNEDVEEGQRDLGEVEQAVAV